MGNNITELIVGCILSLVLTMILVITRKMHGRFSNDYSSGVQKFHTDPTPRIGGLAIYLALWLSLFIFETYRHEMFVLLLSAAPLFFAGLLDDFTNKISWKTRLLFTIISGVIFVTYSGYATSSVDIPIIKPLFKYYPSAFVITVIALAGISNSINIIDGFNGLASGALIIMFGSLAILAYRINDPFILFYSLIHCAVILGFFVFNFPWGRIFLGDGGAYYLGFALGAGVIMLFERNESISPWTATLIIAYPLVETLFSIYRKYFRKGHAPTQPDRVHLHMLIYRSWGRPLANRFAQKDRKNPISGAIMWAFPFLSVLLAQIGLFHTKLSIVFFFLFTLGYIIIYLRVSLVQRNIFKVKRRKSR